MEREDGVGGEGPGWLVARGWEGDDLVGDLAERRRLLRLLQLVSHGPVLGGASEPCCARESSSSGGRHLPVRAGRRRARPRAPGVRPRVPRRLRGGLARGASVLPHLPRAVAGGRAVATPSHGCCRLPCRATGSGASSAPIRPP